MYLASPSLRSKLTKSHVPYGVRELFKFKRRVSSVVRNLQLQSRGLAGLSGGVVSGLSLIDFSEYNALLTSP